MLKESRANLNRPPDPSVGEPANLLPEPTRVAVCPSTKRRHTPSELQIEQPSILVFQGDHGVHQQQATAI